MKAHTARLGNINLSQELVFLIDCIKAGRGKPLRQPPADIDWILLKDLALRHRVYLIVYKRLCACEWWEEMPSGIRESFSAQAKQLGFQQLHGVGELIAINELFNEGELPFLCLKGPPISQLVYGDPVVRQFRDLDLLVMKKDLKRAVTLLGGLGYEMCDKFTWDLVCRGDPIPPSLYHVHLKKGQSLIELHWRLSRNARLLPFGEDQVWKGRRAVDVSGKCIPILGENELLAYMDTHGATHCWSRLKWLWDSHVLASQLKRPCGGKASRVREQLSRHLFHSSDSVGSDSISTLTTQVRFCLSQISTEDEFPGGVLNMLGRSIFVCTLYQGVIGRLRYLTQLLLWPEAYERVRLPKYLGIGYYMIGPVFWFKERVLERLFVVAR